MGYISPIEYSALIKVIIADDHKMFAEGVGTLLEMSLCIKVIGIVENGIELISMLQKDLADVVLLDIDMPEMNGEESLIVLKKMWPSLKVLMLTMHDEASYINQFVKIGANGYVLKNTDGNELIKAIQSVQNGNDFFSYDIINKMHTKTIRHKKPVKIDLGLTEREIEIIKLTAKAMSVKEISKELFISTNTVKTHRKNIQKKIGVINSNGITKFAIDMGWG